MQQPKCLQSIQALPIRFLWAPLLPKHPCKHGHKHLLVMMSCGTEIQMPGTAIASLSLGIFFCGETWHRVIATHHCNLISMWGSPKWMRCNLISTWHVACKPFGGFFLQNLGLSVPRFGLSLVRQRHDATFDCIPCRPFTALKKESERERERKSSNVKANFEECWFDIGRFSVSPFFRCAARRGYI